MEMRSSYGRPVSLSGGMVIRVYIRWKETSKHVWEIICEGCLAFPLAPEAFPWHW